jgi:transposase
MESTKTKQKFIQLRAENLSFEKIAKKLGVSKQTLINWSREFKEEIDNLKTVEIEALLEQYNLHKEGRLKAQALIYTKLKEEVENRDFSTLTTDKLINLLFKYERQLDQEHTEPTVMSSEEIEVSKDSRRGDLNTKRMFAAL